MRGEIKERMDLLAQETEKRKHLAQLRRETLRKIEFLKRKATINAKEVYDLIKDFFKGFLGKDYEFTIGELQKELKNVYISGSTRELINQILEAMRAIEYRNVNYGHEQLTVLLEALEEAVKQLVRSHARKKGFMQKVRSLLFKDEEPEVIIAELPATEDNTAENIRVHTLMERCYLALEKHNLRKAKAAYNALIREYESLPHEEKEQFYPLIDQTYRDMLNR